MWRYYLLFAIAVGVQLPRVTLAEDTISEAIQASGAGDSIWLISSRHLPSTCGGLSDPNALQFKRLDCDGNCSPGDFADYQSDGMGRRTCMYVHGNRVSSSYAIYRGLRVYRKLRRQNAESGPIRFVIWSWPSSQIKGLIRDARVKAARTDSESFYLASLLQYQPQDEPLSLIGFSFGGPIISGALHLLAGGSICGCAMDLESPYELSADVVLMAAAMGNGWLSPRGRFGLAARQIQKVLLLYNSRDRALKRFWVISSRRPGEASVTPDSNVTALESCRQDAAMRRGPTGWRRAYGQPLYQQRLHHWNGGRCGVGGE